MKTVFVLRKETLKVGQWILQKSKIKLLFIRALYNLLATSKFLEVGFEHGFG